MIPSEIATSIGPTLIKKESHLWEIDLSNLRIFFGLSILSRSLSEEITNNLHSLPGDISFIQKINPNINHELIDMHISYVQVHARSGILNDWLLFRDQFEEDLRSVFGTFQRQSIAKKLHPEFYGEDPKLNPSIALLFPFYKNRSDADGRYQILMERVTSQINVGDFFIRITVDAIDSSVLNLGGIKHEVVDDIGKRTYIAGASKISESLNNSIIGAAQKGETFFEEENRHFSKVFEQLEKTPIGRLTHIHFYWEDSFRTMILATDPQNTLPLMKKLFLLLEDADISQTIKEGHTVLAKLGRAQVYVELSRLDRVLNFSFNRKRTQIDSSFYLKRMPILEAIADKKEHSHNFENTHIFLIHHITSEIISMIETLRRLEIKSLDVAFVKYGGNIPPVYLDILLDIPTESFFMAGLEFKLTKNNRPYYGLSPLYSDSSPHRKFAAKLEEAKFGFFDAMKYLATYLFLNKLFKLRKTGEKILLVEDGGYVAPIINQRCKENKTIGEIASEFWVDCPPEFSSEGLSSFISQTVIGTVEHTRNGYDRLKKTAGVENLLTLPAFTIAVSNEKTKEESKEVAFSILNAIENSLHGLGKVLSKRKILLLGSLGNIGGFLNTYLVDGRLHESNRVISQVDLKFVNNGNRQYSDFSHLPSEEFLGIDLIIGVTGESVLKQKDWENWILNSENPNLYVASGSTKTAEFTDLIEWLNDLYQSSTPAIGNIPIRLVIDRIIDPQTGMDLGGKVSFLFESKKQAVEKTLFLLSDGSPINFLFYGVPTESMDPIITQLTTVALGMVSLYKTNSLPKPALYAVDHQIDKWGNPL
ncbi:hypothetical protein LPTSP3_g34320 [Leptospira kobayashii]|uniref:Uncharacterized protein n=1 Tax=Leptospira kobayashii TaxID=1917830 RepID=A0ABM7UN15_9LEPT|nr:hypothetical protein [Leptospira kobayashii]BDA80502.1 hypothetical protein LPTSP3_g34320 [Leptospira kobayashii]